MQQPLTNTSFRRRATNKSTTSHHQTSPTITNTIYRGRATNNPTTPNLVNNHLISCSGPPPPLYNNPTTSHHQTSPTTIFKLLSPTSKCSTLSHQHPTTSLATFEILLQGTPPQSSNSGPPDNTPFQIYTDTSTVGIGGTMTNPAPPTPNNYPTLNLANRNFQTPVANLQNANHQVSDPGMPTPNSIYAPLSNHQVPNSAAASPCIPYTNFTSLNHQAPVVNTQQLFNGYTNPTANTQQHSNINPSHSNHSYQTPLLYHQAPLSALTTPNLVNNHLISNSGPPTLNNIPTPNEYHLQQFIGKQLPPTPTTHPNSTKLVGHPPRTPPNLTSI